MHTSSELLTAVNTDTGNCGGHAKDRGVLAGTPRLGPTTAVKHVLAGTDALHGFYLLVHVLVPRGGGQHHPPGGEEDKEEERRVL